MPCYVTGSREGDLALDSEENRKAAKEATRAACELWRLYREYRLQFGGTGKHVEYSLSAPTLKWVREHDKLDKKRRK